MRIAYDYQVFIIQSYGGASRYYNNLVQGLIDLQQQVKIFAPLHKNNYIMKLPINTVEGRFISKVSPKISRLLTPYNHFYARKKITQWMPDIIHETYYSRFSLSPKKCPTVVTVLDMIHELFPQKLPLIRNTALLKKKSIERADHIICISQNTKRDLMHFYNIPAKKISVVHLGIDTLSSQNDLTSTKPPMHKPFLLYVGGRNGYKNFIGFIKAVASSQKLSNDFSIIAFGGGRFSAQELKTINSLGFSENQVQQITGNDDLLHQYYSAASAFVYPSLYEGFGIPPLEAMAQKCPVISSNTSSMPEIIGNAAYFFNPSVVDEIRHAIESVVYSDSLTQELINYGTKRIALFSWEKCSHQTLNIYRSIIGNKNE